MSTYDIVIDLCKTRGIAPTALEKELGFSNGSIGKMKKNNTSAKRLQIIADYFGVSLEYMLTGKEITQEFVERVALDYGFKKISPTEKEERDVQRELENTLNALDNNKGLMFDGEVMDERTRELLKDSLEFAIRNARKLAKEKYTPKKYKK
ncbi:MAG: helix-turn-helix transcriptional regulator [Anaerovoracaceae bacterium]